MQPVWGDDDTKQVIHDERFNHRLRDLANGWHFTEIALVFHLLPASVDETVEAGITLK